MPRRCILSALGLAVLVACSLDPRPAVTQQPLAVSAEAVPLHPNRPEMTRVGQLVWRGGLELDSGHDAFGGLSGLWVAPDGGRMLAVGDKGSWLAAELTYDAAGHMAGVAQAEIGPLGNRAGAPVSGRWRDAEALARTAAGALLVSFEGRHRIWRYAGEGQALAGAAESVPMPALLSRAPGNGGLEALTVLADGRWLALTEELFAGERRVAFLYDGQGWARLSYPGDPDFAPTDAAQLPGGDLLVVERKFNPLTGVAIRLRRVPLSQLAPGGNIAGEIIATLRPPMAVDNYEGLAVRRGRDGETLIYLLSDDNFNFLQRTLLVMFELEESGPGTE